MRHVSLLDQEECLLIHIDPLLIFEEILRNDFTSWELSYRSLFHYYQHKVVMWKEPKCFHLFRDWKFILQF